MNVMKILKVVLAGALLIIACNACDERLDLKPLSETEAGYFTEEIHYEKAILGVYAKMSDIYWYNNNNPIHMFWLLPGDDLTSTGDIEFEVFRTLQPGTGPISTYWRTSYQLINRANVVLQKIEQEENVIITPGLKNYIKGEALFLRALTFFRLWNYFGPAPLIDERIQSSEEINQPNSEGDELLDKAIADFQEAVGLLPQSWDETNRGRADKNAAYGMLGKALVFRASWTGNSADYTSAINAFQQIQGKSLVPRFMDNFSVTMENNDESLFEYQAGSPSYDNVWLSNDFNQAIGSYSAYYGYFDDHWSFWAHTPYIATQKLIAAFEVGDPRAEATIDPANRRIRKYVTEDQLTGSGVASYNNPRILRYADVLLLWAEALNETGNSNGAVDLINEVRTRARNEGATGVPADYASGASQSQVRSWIENERYLELVGEEGHRWLDLRRWHKAGFINLSSWNFSSDNASFAISLPKHLLYPIPSSETDLNSAIQQNPEY
jgi:tetratricopeptide (TPR) repeat protein